ncbi:MAG: DNA recombination protein RmuC [Myxococcota bacterium]
MTETLLVAVVVLLLAVVVLQVITLLRHANSQGARRLEGQLAQLRDSSDRSDRTVRDELSRSREEFQRLGRETRTEMASSFRLFSDELGAQLQTQEGRLERIRETVDTHLRTLQQDHADKLEKMVTQARESSGHVRTELADSLSRFESSLVATMTRMGQMQGQAIAELKSANDLKLETMRGVMEQQIRQLQEDNHRQLEQMRATVDEKLHATLEARLGESFRLVSERLELVHRGLGEMQTLAAGVGDLKKVLTNVKTRGIWGEVQLEGLLEQILTPDQYLKNVATKLGSAERVEFAVRFPGRGGNGPVWLPIDAKFPQEDYQRLLEAQDQANPAAADEAGRRLEERIRLEARTIREKYVDPPNTTDFAIMFLPVEGLYAEVLRRPGISEMLQRDHRVMLTGPTTLAALLQSLRMGFNTLAIEKRSSEVWELLRGVKSEFGKFGEILEKTRRKLEQASAEIHEAATRTRQIERRLRDVQDSPDAAPRKDSMLPLLARMEQGESVE